MDKCINNMGGGSLSNPFLIDDDFDDEKYIEELQLQEALSFVSITPSPPSYSISKQPMVSESSNSLESLCGICMDTKTSREMFQNTDACDHMFCFDCIRQHVAAKILENKITVTCPDPNCKVVIGPEVCRSFVPQEVLERWEKIMCESLIKETDKFYCPFKDCSALLVDDGGEAVTASECPICNRLFCAQCKVAWHCDMNCIDFQSLKKGEPNPNDNLLIDLANNEKWMKCPNCKIFVEKVDGCLHISCRCGHHFCYKCGKAKQNGADHNCPTCGTY